MWIAFYTILFFSFLEIDCRVWCFDSGATPWIALGHSCPVTCHIIRAALLKLKMTDYTTKLNHQVVAYKKQHKKDVEYNDYKTDNENNININEISDDENKNKYPTKEDLDDEFNQELDNSVKNLIDVKYLNIINKTNMITRILSDTSAMNNLKMNYQNNYRTDNDCDKLFESYKKRATPLVERLLERCARRSSAHHDHFIKVFTNILNDYADEKYKFTEETTGMILQNIVGTSLDLRNTPFNLSKVLRYIKVAIEKKESMKTKDTATVILKSKSCITPKLPGCYCKSKYVENEGQCVLPSDCVKDDKDYIELLKRIKII